ncbi:MAG TPA: chorismate mutase, partial [Glaciecola sp.]|nr:chorismate mutase [Glaciecola sp.]
MASAPLSSVREAISELDVKLLELLAQRQQLTNEVARTKIQNQIDVRDPQREEQLLVRLIQEGQKLGLNAHYITKLFHVVIEDSVLNQQAMLSAQA